MITALSNDIDDVKAFAVARAGWAKAFEQFGIPKGTPELPKEGYGASNT